MNRHLFTTCAIAALLATGAARADSVQPTFNLTGSWQDTGGTSASFFQEGNELTFVSISGGFAHYYVGRYITPTKVEGIQHRVDRSTGCSTEMRLTLTATSSGAANVWSKVLDSNCDLAKNQILTGSVSRTQ
jgi:hypothetical protein